MWKRITTEMPPENTRVLISDGLTIAICRYILGNEYIHWLHDGEAFKDIKVIYWMYLPILPPEVKQISAEL